MRKPVPTLYLVNNIFYPQTVIPLTVSDAVSKQMLIDCFEKSTNIALYHPHNKSKGIGTLGEILMLDFNGDGSLSATVQGLARIKLLNKETDRPFPLYHIDDYFDVNENKSHALFDSPIERLHCVLERWLNRHINSARERDRFMRDMSSPTKLINNLCIFVIKDIELKQIFLESTSLLDRVRMMNALLVGENPEAEDLEICEAIKNFERLETNDYLKNAS